MPHVMTPYNRSIAFYSGSSDTSETPVICFYRHYIERGADGLVFIRDGGAISAYDTLLHELGHHYQAAVLGDDMRKEHPHHIASWYKMCHFVCDVQLN